MKLRTMGLLGALSFFGFGCGGDALPGDGGAFDAAQRCASDVECDDGVFCNGIERCVADACVAASAPCGAGTTCDEESQQCALGCDTDADGDGAIAVACGGDDCDDDDPLRHPGATEVCDPDHRDEDCNPLTVGPRDEDEDGYIDARCCNRLATGALHCGDDCDDSRPNVHRSASEVCDDLDNDCDSNIDEGVSHLLWPDVDRDSFGDASAEPERHCSFVPGHALVGGDCDDEDPSLNPGTHDVCNGVDDDCDANVDEGAEALCNRADGIAEAACVHLEGEPAPRCVITACDAQRLDCDLDPASGCEANFCDDLAHCGACGGYGGACSFGYCRDGRCSPDAVRVNELAGRVVRDGDGSPVAGAVVRRLRDCTASGDSAVANASGDFTVRWEYQPPFQHFKTEAAGYATQLDPEATADDIRLLEIAELDALLAMSPVPVDRRLGVVVVDSGDGGFEIVEPIFGTYRAPAIPGHGFEVPLPDGRVRQVFVNVRPGTARVRVVGAGDARRTAVCNTHGPDWPGDWNAPSYHDVVVSQEGIVHLRFGWCTVLAVGG